MRASRSALPPQTGKNNINPAALAIAAYFASCRHRVLTEALSPLTFKRINHDPGKHLRQPAQLASDQTDAKPDAGAGFTLT